MQKETERTKNTNDLKVEDYVRLYKFKNKFEKSSKHRWTKEIFKVVEVLPYDQIVYRVCDKDGNVIVGKFYRQELTEVTVYVYKVNGYL